MKYRSTREKGVLVSAREAILRGLAADGGLFMPEQFPEIAPALREAKGLTFPAIAEMVATPFLEGEIAHSDIRSLCLDAFNFPVPLVEVEKDTYVLELFHGPTLAFKDFGARFMARCMASFLSGSKERTVLLVATSGDTGGAVAQGFHGLQGIEVIVLYPSGKVSPLQERQFTTLGGNVTALEVRGTFDDCQRMVKELFAEKDLTSKVHLASANSINIARLIPQSFYYFWALSTLGWPANVEFVTPSGNFGNLTAGLFAERMGLTVSGFTAATNRNDPVPEYLESGVFKPRPSVETISNAMDVGNPSNFERMMDLFGGSVEAVRRRVTGVRCTDAETEDTMRETYQTFGYLADPHTAVGLFAAEKRRAAGYKGKMVVLGTAHPVKFNEVIERVLAFSPPIPLSLAKSMKLPKLSKKIEPESAAVRAEIER